MCFSKFSFKKGLRIIFLVFQPPFLGRTVQKKLNSKIDHAIRLN